MKPNSIVNDKDLNGLPVSFRGRTAYKGVGYLSCWSFSTKMYVALVGLNADERKIAGKDTFIWHLSVHDNPLDAAYVTMKFHEDKAANVKKLNGVAKGAWDYGQLPTFEFEPLGVKHEVVKPARTKTKIKTCAQAVQVDNRWADKHFDVLHMKYDIAALVTKFGRDTVVAARKLLTINEFELRFGL